MYINSILMSIPIDIKHFGDIKKPNEIHDVLFIDFDDTFAVTISSSNNNEFIALSSPDLQRTYDDLFESEVPKEKRVSLRDLSFVSYAILDKTLLTFLKNLEIPWYILSAGPIDQRRQKFIKRVVKESENKTYQGYIFCKTKKTECIRGYTKYKRPALIDNSLFYGLRYNSKEDYGTLTLYHHTLMRSFMEKMLAKEVKKLPE